MSTEAIKQLEDLYSGEIVKIRLITHEVIFGEIVKEIDSGLFLKPKFKDDLIFYPFNNIIKISLDDSE